MDPPAACESGKDNVQWGTLLSEQDLDSLNEEGVLGLGRGVLSALLDAIIVPLSLSFLSSLPLFAEALWTLSSNLIVPTPLSDVTQNS